MAVCEMCGKTFERTFGGGEVTGGGTAFKCPECAAKSLDATLSPRKQRNRAAAEFAIELKRIAPAGPVVTWALIALCTGAFALEIAKGAGFDTMSPDLAIQLGANYGPMTLGGQWWRLLTSMFLHFGILHIALNMWCLYVLGTLAERLMGRTAFLTLYLATGLAGGLLSVAIHPQLVAAGASGAVFGVAGGIVTYLWLGKAPLDFARVRAQLGNLGIFLGINLIYSFRPGVDMMAHLGGVIAGLAIGAALPSFLRAPGAQAVPSPIKEESSGSMRVVIVGIVCAVLLFGGALAVRHMQGDGAYVLASLEKIDAGQSAAVIPTLEQIVKRRPDSAMAHYALGAAYLRTDRSEDAIRELQASDTLDPGDAATEDQLGVAYLIHKDYDNAIKEFRACLNDSPNNFAARLGLASALLSAGQTTEAASEARKVIAAAPKSAGAHAVLGEAELGTSAAEDGVHELETANQLDPDDPDIRSRLISAYIATGHRDKVLAMTAIPGSQDKNPSATPSGQKPGGR